MMFIYWPAVVAMKPSSSGMLRLELASSKFALPLLQSTLKVEVNRLCHGLGTVAGLSTIVWPNRTQFDDGTQQAVVSSAKTSLLC
jgi:hypothetical protein